MCGEERDVCLNGFAGIGQNLEAVLVVLVCAGGGSVVPRHPAARGREDTRRTGGVRTLDGPAALSADRDGRRSMGRPRRVIEVKMWMGMSVDVLCCVVVYCVVLGCVVLCCVVLCCVVLCCVVLVVSMGCGVLCVG